MDHDVLNEGHRIGVHLKGNPKVLAQHRSLQQCRKGLLCQASRVIMAWDRQRGPDEIHDTAHSRNTALGDRDLAAGE